MRGTGDARRLGRLELAALGLDPRRAPPSAGTGRGTCRRAGRLPARSRSAARRGSAKTGAPSTSSAARNVDERLLVLRVRASAAAPRSASGSRARSAGGRARARGSRRARASGSPARPFTQPTSTTTAGLHPRAAAPRARRAGQPAGGLRVGAAALAGEEQPAQAQRDEQQPPRALGLAPPAVLGEEAQVAAHLLTEHRAPALPRRRPADVHELRVRGEEHLPARLAEAVAASPSPR